MIQPKNFTILLFSLFLTTGCVQTQKKVAPLSMEPIYGTPPKPMVEKSLHENTDSKTPIKPLGFEDLNNEENEQPVEEERKVVQSVLPSMGYVNDRIFEYGRKLNRWKEIDAQSASLELKPEDSERMVDCFKDLRKVLEGYNRLRSDMLQLNTESSDIIIGRAEVMNLQKNDITFLEGNCGRLLASDEDETIDWEQRAEGADLPQIETLIERYTGSREYEEVVQAWLQIPANQTERVHLRTKILYGNALMFLHQEEKAAEIYQQIVDEMSVSDMQRTDLLSLRKLLADLYTAAGDYQAAEKQYVNISKDYTDLGELEEWSQLQLDILERSEKGGPELTAFSKLLRNFLGFIPERDGYKLVWEADDFLQNYPYSAIASNVDIIKNNAKERADKWFNGFMTTVDTMAAEKKFLEGIEMLEVVPGDIISIEQKDQIKTKNDDLILAEAVERETRKIQRMQELQHKWNEGMILVDAGKYDAAIEIFTTLLETEYYAKAEDKIKEISLRAAKADRRKAADLFLRYTKTTDIESKKKLLLESRKLLSEILIKYPEVEIVDKVTGNIKRVEKEMSELDPNLLLRMPTSGQNGGESRNNEFQSTSSNVLNSPDESAIFVEESLAE